MEFHGEAIRDGTQHHESFTTATDEPTTVVDLSHIGRHRHIAVAHPKSTSLQQQILATMTRGNISEVLVVCLASLGSVTFGYSAAVIGTSLGQPSFLQHMGLDTSSNASSLIGAMNALFFVGGIFGSFFQGWMANAHGRRMSIVAGCTIVVVSGALLTASVNPAMFIVFRLFNGWGAFQLLAGVPLFVTEIASPRYRGVITDIHAVGLNIGYTVSGYIGLGFYFSGGHSAWRWPMLIQIAPPLLLLFSIYWIPESPRWLLTKGRTEDAWNVVSRLHSSNEDFATSEFEQMKRHIDFERTLDDSYVTILRRPSYRRRAAITVFLTFTLFSCGTLVLNSGFCGFSDRCSGADTTSNQTMVYYCTETLAINRPTFCFSKRVSVQSSRPPLNLSNE